MSEALAVKYRPRTIEDFVGQKRVVRAVRGMLKRQSPSQTILISGPYGSGKTTMARLISRYLNCQGKDRKMEEPPCGECEACKRMERGALQDYQEINAASKRGIDSIRTLIDNAQFRPNANFRIFVLDEVHKITADAAEALLKITEEPPPESILILCTTDPQKMKGSLRSRCMKLNMDLVEQEDIARLLMRVIRGEKASKEVFNKDVLMKIASLVDGHPRDAVATLEVLINQVEDEGEIEDIDAAMIKIIEDVIPVSEDKIAAAMLLGIYAGKATAALLALEGTSSYKTLAEQLVEFHTHAMRWRFSPKLHDKMFYAWHAKLKDLGKENLDPHALAGVMDILIDSLQKVAQFEFDARLPYYTLFNTAVKASALCKGSAKG